MRFHIAGRPAILLALALLGTPAQTFADLSCLNLFTLSGKAFSVLYSQRQAQMSKGDFEATYIAYAAHPEEAKTHPDSVLKGESGWLPERQALHSQIVAEYLNYSLKLSDQLAQSPFAHQANKPLLILTRGNSGSGKTYSVRNSSYALLKSLNLSDAILKNEKGVLNPDTIKFDLQNNVEQGRVSSQAVHEEGSMLTSQIIAQLFAAKKNLVVDKRFPTLDSLEKIARVAKSNGYYVVVIDIEAPLDVSAQRLVGRPVGGESPNVPFGAISSGYVDIRNNRQAISTSPLIDNYVLLQGSAIVAERVPNQGLQIRDTDKWKQATSTPQASEISLSEFLYGDMLNALSRILPAEFLRPFGKPMEAVSSAPLKFQLLPEDINDPHPKNEYAYLLRLRDQLYYAQKDFGLQQHQALATTLGEYLRRLIPGVQISFKVFPETNTLSASVSVIIQTSNTAAKAQLLSEPIWKASIDPQSNKLNPAVIISTRTLTRINPEQTIETIDRDEQDFAMGRSQRDSLLYGSLGHDFIMTANDQGRGLNQVPIVKIRGPFRFSQETNNARFFLDAFRSDESEAYLFGAEIEVLQAKDAASKNDTLAIKQHLATAQRYLNSAMEFLAATDYALKNYHIQSSIQIEGLTIQNSQGLEVWLKTAQLKIDALHKAMANL